MRMIPRENYDHPGPLGPALDLSQVTGWDFHHTAGSLDATPHAIADFGVGKFGRSSYNFFISQVHNEGDVYEMQGLHRGAHNDGENSTRLGVVFAGYYHPDVDHQPSEEMLEAAAQLLAHGHEEWGIPIDVKGHRDPDTDTGDDDNTACPGDHLYERMDDVARRAREIVAGGGGGTTTPDPTDPEEQEMLKRGDDGDAVRAYQRRLLEWAEGRTGDPYDAAREYGADGDYGPNTEAMVEEFQTAYDLPVTGQIGDVTAGLLAMYATGGGGGGGTTEHTHKVVADPRLTVGGTDELSKAIANHLQVHGILHTKGPQ